MNRGTRTLTAISGGLVTVAAIAASGMTTSATGVPAVTVTASATTRSPSGPYTTLPDATGTTDSQSPSKRRQAQYVQGFTRPSVALPEGLHTGSGEPRRHFVGTCRVPQGL